METTATAQPTANEKRRILRGLLALPIFDSEELTQSARRFYTVAWDIMLAVTFFVVLEYILEPKLLQREVTALMGVDLLGLAMLEVNRRGKTRLASWSFVIGLIVLATLTAPSAGGIRSPGNVSYMVLVLMAGLLLGEQAGIWAAVICSILGLGLVLAEMYGALPAEQIEFSPFSLWLRSCLRMVMVLILMRLALRAVEGALRRAETELAERRKGDQERQKAEEALQASERRFRSLVEKAPVAVSISRAGKTIYVNQKYLDLYKFQSVDELAGHPISEQWAPEHRSMIEDRARRRSLGEELPTEYEGSGQCKDGTQFPVSVAVGTVELPDGPASMAILTNITERRQLAEQLRQSQKMEAIGQLAGGVAHDFNNILAGIMLQVEESKSIKTAPPEVLDGLRQIQVDAERAAKLTSQMLLFSRKQIMQAANLDLNDAVTNLARMLRRIIGEHIRLQLDLHSAPLTTHADPSMLDQILLNLTVNARDAMPQGGNVLIQTSEIVADEKFAQLNPDARPGRYVCLSVTDTGSGIPPEVLPRIFEPFFTTKEQGKGTGLGLATVFGIVQQHRGFLRVESEPGKGARFQIFLPACAAPSEPPKVAEKIPARGGTETILLVEDEEHLRSLARSVLQRNGYRVFEAGNGVEALEIWKQQRDGVHLLLTDLVMPFGISGQNLASQLQQTKPQLKVVFTTGHSSEIAGRQIELKPSENFLQKPFSADLLLETVRQCLDGPSYGKGAPEITR